MRTALYILACIVIPVVWGIAASWAFDLVNARIRKPSTPEVDEPAPNMFYI